MMAFDPDFKPMKQLSINRWAYLSVVTVISVGMGIALQFGDTVAQVALALALPALTFPMGLFGALCALPLIYFGIATTSEAYIVAAPVYAVAGWLQWYVVFPKLFANRVHSPLNTDIKVG
jgi:hypothetical protein